MIDKRLNFKGGGGSDNRPTMADIAGPVTAPTTSLPSNIGFNNGGGSDNRPTMADIAGPVTAPTIPGGPSFVTFDNPYMSQGLEMIFIKIIMA
jgi:hypothetical protein